MAYYIQAIDPGLVNLAISTFKVFPDNRFQLIKMELRDINNFREITNHIKKDVKRIIIEPQPRQSKLHDMIIYLEGFCKAKNIEFEKRRIFSADTYKTKKKKSIELLMNRDRFFHHCLLYSENFPKIDDIADSFNLGYNNLSPDYVYNCNHAVKIKNYKR